MGLLTLEDARHLTPSEYEHYFELGLVPPPTRDFFGLFRDHYGKELQYAEQQRDELNDTAVDLTQTVGELTTALGIARGDMEGATQELKACRRELESMRDYVAELEYHLRARARAQASESD